MSKRTTRKFGFEQLEGRRLLAADFGLQFTQLPALPAEVCVGVEMVDEVTQADDAGEDSFSDLVEQTENSTGDDALEFEESTDIESEANLESEVEPDGESEAELEIVSEQNELRDPVTGTSGYFGVIDAQTPAKTISFSPSESGTVDVVTASSFGDSETRLEVTDSNGDLIAASMTEDLEGFQKLTFEVEANESYLLEVSSDETGEGNFMVTVEFVENVDDGIEEPVDVHSDEIGESATELTFENGEFAIASALETEDDRDAFRFLAPANGEAVLGLKTLSEDHQSDAVVSVFDAEGELIVEGLTNEEVMIRFDTTEGVEYHVLVDSSNDAKAEFELSGSLFPETLIEESEVQGDSASDSSDAIEEEIDFCESSEEPKDGTLEREVVDDLFEDLASEVAREFGNHRHGLWFGWF